MILLPDHLGATLADELLKQSERDASATPMDAVWTPRRAGHSPTITASDFSPACGRSSA
jgi:hypothetical protein